MLIDDVLVSERRRQDLGDIDGLADSIRRYGLLHPVVVDSDGNLVAGERRLRACHALGWTHVDVRYLGDLSESERREIELEENLRRKDLTEYERSRNLVDLAETAAEVLKEEAEESPMMRGCHTRGRLLIGTMTDTLNMRCGRCGCSGITN